MNERGLDLAAWLVSNGAGASARRMLSHFRLRGAEANNLRERAASARLQSRVYGLIVPADYALVVPLSPQLGRSTAESSEYGETLRGAVSIASAACGSSDAYSLRLEAEERLTIHGRSLGLASALAFVSYLRGAGPTRAVIATGTVDSSGAIGPVDNLALKIAAARDELGDALLLVPSGAPDGIPVSTFGEACHHAFGATRFELRRDLLSIDEILRAIARVEDHEAALRQLEAIDPSELSPSEQATILIERGNRARHLGRPTRAKELHDRGLELLSKCGELINRSVDESCRMEAYSTEIDQFELIDLESHLRRRLTEPFLDPHNRVRCRGMLAQVVSMRGRPKEAIAIRAESLNRDHRASGALRREIPRTLCNLALDSALAVDRESFDRWVRELLKQTRSDDTSQWRFNTNVVIRGLVRFAEPERALAWFRDGLFGTRPPRDAESRLLDPPHVTDYPEVSTLRSLCRAYRLIGQPGATIAHAKRAAHEHQHDLIAWLAGLVHLEATIVTRDLATAGSIRRTMAARSPNASRFYRTLFDADLVELEKAIDGVWY